ncbi:MAG: hypothetical protein V7K19_13565 [Nostoc sp.]
MTGREGIGYGAIQFWIMELMIAQRKPYGMATLREAAPTLRASPRTPSLRDATRRYANGDLASKSVS